MFGRRAKAPQAASNTEQAAHIKLPDKADMPSSADYDAADALAIAQHARDQRDQAARDKTDVVHTEAELDQGFTRMARELSDAVIAHLNTLPPPVRLQAARNIYHGVRRGGR